MTSTPVMGMMGVQTIDSISPVTNSSKSDSPDFKSFMDNAGNNYNKVIKNDRTSQDNDQIKESFRSDGANDKIKDTKLKTHNDEEVTENVTADDVDEVKEAITEVVEKIKEELDVSDEEIINTLNAMGLNPVALLVPENVTNFVVEITETEDPILIATDENLMNAVESIGETVNESIEKLCEDLGIDIKEFAEAVEMFQKSETTVVDENIQLTEVKDVENLTDTEVDSEPTVVKNNEVVYNKPQVVENVVIEQKVATVDSAEPKKENIVDNEVEFNNKTSILETEDENAVPVVDKNTATDDNHETNSNFLSFAQNLVKETVNALNEASTEKVFTTVDAVDVINQITETIKTQVTGDVTEVSLKLHPETLGNVSVKITANNEGVLTARFIADNEAVKNVIEAQAVSLKETLESKGVTIEAVEVMVGSHEFEENMNRERNNEFSKQTSSRRTRRISIGDADELVDETDEEAKLAQEIMKQNGNTIDYTA